MAARDLARKVLARVQSGGTRDYTSYAADLAAALTEYILGNTTIQSVYTGMIGPTPDPIVADSHKVLGQVPVVPGSSDFSGWIRKIADGIRAGFVLAPGTIGLTPVKPILPFQGCPPIVAETIQGNMLGSFNDNTDNPAIPVWTALAQGLIDWMNLGLAAIPGGPAGNSKSGSVGTFTGLSGKIV